jgi:Txe/YoeB family toxin of toxin-antitoxin system
LAYKVIFSRQANKDLEKIKKVGLGWAVKKITDVLKENPYKTPPYFEKLTGDLHDYFSRRINIKHRYVYQILPNDTGVKDENGNLYNGFVHVLRMWTHYE